MARNNALNFPAKNVIFGADDYLYEEFDSDVTNSLGGFRTSNPDGNRCHRQVFHSSTRSKYKKTVELVLCIHGWKDPSKKEPMTLIVLGVSLHCHDPDSRFQSVEIKLRFDEDDDRRDPSDTIKANPQVVALAPFVREERWNKIIADVKDNSEYGGKLGLDQFVQTELNATQNSERSYTRTYFDRGSAERIYNAQAHKFDGVEWYLEQNKLAKCGVKPEFHLAVLLERVHDGDRPIPFRAELDMRTQAGTKYDFTQGLRRFFRCGKPEDDPVYFDASKGKPIVYGMDGVGEKLLEYIEADNLGALAKGRLLSQLVASAGSELPALLPMGSL